MFLAPDAELDEKQQGFSAPENELDQPEKPSGFVAPQQDVEAHIDDLAKDHDNYDPHTDIGGDLDTRVAVIQRRTKPEFQRTWGQAIEKTGEALKEVPSAVAGFVTAPFKVAKQVGRIVKGGFVSPDAQAASRETLAAAQSQALDTAELGKKVVRNLNPIAAVDRLMGKKHTFSALKSDDELTPDEIKQALIESDAIAKEREALSKGDIATEGGPINLSGMESPEALAKKGAAISAENIEGLKPMFDPVNVVPGLEVPGANRIAGKGLEVAGKTISAPARAVATVAEKIPLPRSLRRFGAAPTLITGAEIGAAALHSPAAAAGIAGTVAAGVASKKAGTFLEQIGKELGGKTLAPADRGIFGSIAARAGKGAAHGAVNMIPFALAEDTIEGAVSSLATGAGIGGVYGLAQSPTKSRFADTDRTTGAKSGLSTLKFDYNTTPTLDALHNEAYSRMTPEQQAEANKFRHAMQGIVETYTLPEDAFNELVREEAQKNGMSVEDAQNFTTKGFFDTAGEDGIRRAYVKEGTKDPYQTAWHEMTHALDETLTPEQRKRTTDALFRANDMDAVTKRYIADLYKGREGEIPSWKDLPQTAKEATNRGLPTEASKDYIGGELRAEMGALIMRSEPIERIANGNQTLKRRLQDWTGRIAEKLGYKVNNEDAKSILGVNPSFTAAAILRGAMHEQFSGAGEAPSYGNPKTAGIRLAELDAILAKRPTETSSVEEVKAWQAAQREAKGIREAMKVETSFPAAGTAPVPPSKPSVPMSSGVSEAINSDAMAALTGAMKLPKATASALIRQAHNQHGTPITTSDGLIEAALKIHGGGKIEPGQYAKKSEAPKAPIEIKAGETFEDELGHVHKVTGAHAEAPRIGDFVMTPDGIRKVSRQPLGGTVDTIRPSDTGGTGKSYKIEQVQRIETENTGPKKTTEGDGMRVEPFQDRFRVVDAKGNPVDKNTFATQSAAEQSIRQKGKRVPIGKGPGGEDDILNVIHEMGGISAKKKTQEYDDMVRSAGSATSIFGGTNAPEDVSRELFEMGRLPKDDVATMWEAVRKAIVERANAKDQERLTEENERQAKAEDKNQTPEPTNEQGTPTPDEGVYQGTATAVQEREIDSDATPAAPLSEDQIAALAHAAEAVESGNDANFNKRELKKGNRVPTVEGRRKIETAGVKEAARVHAESVPENYDGITQRVDPFGKESISGKTIRPERPFDAYLLKLANASQKAKDTIAHIVGNIGKHISIEYRSAQGTDEEVNYASTRKAAQKKSKAAKRVAEQSGQVTTKVYVPEGFRFNPGEKSITVIGSNPEKLLNNFEFAQEQMEHLGIPVPYRSIHDPKMVADIKGIRRNHANGYTWDGRKIKGFPDIPTLTATPVKGYEPYSGLLDAKGEPDVNRFEFLNLILGDESARLGARGPTPEKTAKQALYNANRDPYSGFLGETGETNALRELINSKTVEKDGPVALTDEQGKPILDKNGNPKTAPWSTVFLENPLSEALAINNIESINDKVGKGASKIREHGYYGDLTRFFGKSPIEGEPEVNPTQERVAAAARFMPETAGAENAGDKTKERAAKLWQEKGTDSPFFKKWFGDSKVVDGIGNPAIMHHRTAATEFSEFKPWTNFGTKEQSENVDLTGREEGADRTYDAYIKIENPLRVQDEGMGASNVLQQAYENGVVTQKELREYPWNESDEIVRQYVIDTLEKHGFDGIVYSNEFEGNGDSYIIFRPEQIKSATDNAGTFDAKNPDIRFMPEAATKEKPTLKSDAVKQAAFFRQQMREAGYDKLESVPESILANWSAQWRESHSRVNEDGSLRFMPETEDYGISHRPNSEGPRAFDLLEGGIAQPDIYDNPDYYTGQPGTAVIRQTMAVLRKIRGKPESEVTVYRASPREELNDGDWISLSRQYAKQHGMADDPRDDVPVHSFKVKAKDVRWSLDELGEFGYFPENKTSAYIPEPTLYIAGKLNPQHPDYRAAESQLQRRLGESYAYLRPDEKEQEIRALLRKDAARRRIAERASR